MITSAKLKNIVSKKSLGNNTISAQLYQMFFFERILERISISRYKDNIILKGGLLLSSIIGEDMRTTKDMDATLKSVLLEKSNILNIMSEILAIPLNDSVEFEIVDIKDIREEDEYGGFKINIVGMLEKLRVNMFVEFTTGDKITPKEIDYNYNSIFEDKKISILAYTIETILAEKFETIISRSIANTRLKDFYDIYILMSNYKDIISNDVLVEAIKNTFRKRETNINVDKISEVIFLIRNDNVVKNYWEKYQSKFSFSQGINYNEIMDKLEYILLLLEKEFVSV